MSTNCGVSLSTSGNHGGGGIERFRTLLSTSVELSPATSGYDRADCRRDEQRQQSKMGLNFTVNRPDEPEVVEGNETNDFQSPDEVIIERKTARPVDSTDFRCGDVNPGDDNEDRSFDHIHRPADDLRQSPRSQQQLRPLAPQSEHLELKLDRSDGRIEESALYQIDRVISDARIRSYSGFRQDIIASVPLKDNNDSDDDADSRMIVLAKRRQSSSIRKELLNHFETGEVDQYVDNVDYAMDGDRRSSSSMPFRELMFTSTSPTELSIRRHHMVEGDRVQEVYHRNESVSESVSVSSAVSVAIAAAAEAASSSLFQTSSSPNTMSMHQQHHSRGVFSSSTSASSKLLKCPNCNWHYKYRETLEIHLREKHAGEFLPSYSPLNSGADGQRNSSSSSLADGGVGGDALSAAVQQSSVSCPYCNGGAGPHPRLARGESHPCGYKPYRCDVCSYSTTTKGNLSIHMQSDRHLNNVQELAGRAAVVMTSAGLVQSPQPLPPFFTSAQSMSLRTTTSVQPPPYNAEAPETSGASARPQPGVHHGVHRSPSLGGTSGPVSSTPGDGAPIWRCDVCGYATPVARNLRIHMTSEKHAHNVAILQQQQQQELYQFPATRTSSGVSGWQSSSHSLQVLGKPTTSNELQRHTYDLMQLAGAFFSGGGGGAGGGVHQLKQPQGLVNDSQRPGMANHSTTHANHGMTEPTAGRRAESASSSLGATSAALFECETCPYRTNLRANFHLHCQTDKHLQRVGEALAMIERRRLESTEREVIYMHRDPHLNARWIDGSGPEPGNMNGRPTEVEAEATDFRRQRRLVFGDRRNGDDEENFEDEDERNSKYSSGEGDGVHGLCQRKEDTSGAISRPRQQTRLPEMKSGRSPTSTKSSTSFRCRLCRNEFEEGTILERHLLQEHAVKPEMLQILCEELTDSDVDVPEESHSDEATTPWRELVIRSSGAETSGSSGTPRTGSSLQTAESPDINSERRRSQSQAQSRDHHGGEYGNVSVFPVYAGAKFKRTRSTEQRPEVECCDEEDDDEERLKRAKLQGFDDDDSIMENTMAAGGVLQREPRRLASNISDIIVAMATGRPYASRSANKNDGNETITSGNLLLVDDDETGCTNDAGLNRRFTVKSEFDVDSGSRRYSSVKDDDDCRRSSTGDNAEDAENGTPELERRSTTRNQLSVPGDDHDDDIPGHRRGGVGCSAAVSDQRSRQFPLDRLLQTVGLECVVRFIAAAHQRTTGHLPEHLRKLLRDEGIHLGEMELDRNGSVASPIGGAQQSSVNGYRCPSVVGNRSEELRGAHDAELRYLAHESSQLAFVDRSGGYLLKNDPSNTNSASTADNHVNNHVNDLVKLFLRNENCSGFNPSDVIVRSPNLGLFGLPPHQLGVIPTQLMAMMMMMMAPPFGVCPPLASGATVQPYSSGSSTHSSGRRIDHSPTESAASCAAAAVSTTSDDARLSATSRRVRTRITADQLAILRARFDISAGTPSDDELAAISDDAGLPPKVVKHWFRNTLFKERQRSKDSPYNFANPPAGRSTLDTEEPESYRPVDQRRLDDRTGGYRVRHEVPEYENNSPNNVASVNSKPSILISDGDMPERSAAINVPVEGAKPASQVPPSIKLEHLAGTQIGIPHQSFQGAPFGMIHPMIATAVSASVEDVVASTASRLTMSTDDQRLVQQQLNQHHHQQQQLYQPPHQQQHHGKRASRTHFTDDQVQVLHEHFERNAYPRDDELEALSRRLGLSARVIVVWFQNARQKARRNYENQTASSSTASMHVAPSGASSATAPANRRDGVGSPPSGSRSGLSSSDESCGAGATSLRYDCKSCPAVFQDCKSCPAVFQRYYDLIKHHRSHAVDQSQPSEPADPRQQSNVVAMTSSTARAGIPLVAMTTDRDGSHGDNQKSSVAWPTRTPPTTMVELGRLATLLSPRGLISVQSSMVDNRLSSDDEDDAGSEDDRTRPTQSSVLNLKLTNVAGSREDACENTGTGNNATYSSPESSQVAHSSMTSPNVSLSSMVKQEVDRSDGDKSPTDWTVDDYHPKIARKGNDRFEEVNTLVEFKDNAAKRLSSSPDNCSAERNRVASGSPRVVPEPADALLVTSPTTNNRLCKESDLDSSACRTPVDLIERSISKGPNDEAPLDLRSSNSKTSGDPMDNRSAVDGTGTGIFSTTTTSTNSATSTSSAGGATGRSSSSSSSKRHRTHMSDHQVRVMRAIYAEHRTPSIGECTTVGAKIGLARRVVQVWFQNARAKDKKKAAANCDGVSDEQRQQLSLADDDAAADTDADSITSNGTTSGGSVQCRWCGAVYAATRCATREHLFSSEHVGAVDRIVRTTTANAAAKLSAAEAQRGRSSKKERRRGLAASLNATLSAVNVAGVVCRTSPATGGQVASPCTSRSSTSGGDVVTVSPPELTLYLGNGINRTDMKSVNANGFVFDNNSPTNLSTKKSDKLNGGTFSTASNNVGGSHPAVVFPQYPIGTTTGGGLVPFFFPGYGGIVAASPLTVPGYGFYGPPSSSSSAAASGFWSTRPSASASVNHGHQHTGR